MRFKKLRTFREECFDDPKPDLRTLMKWPEVTKRGGVYYIDLDSITPTLTPRDRPPPPPKRTRRSGKHTPEREALIERMVKG